jgi:hypothetical protein
MKFRLKGILHQPLCVFQLFASGDIGVTSGSDLSNEAVLPREVNSAILAAWKLDQEMLDMFGVNFELA